MVIVLHLTDDRVHRLDLGDRIDIGSINDVDQQIGVDDFLQGGAKRLNELSGKVPHETDGVGQDHRSAVIELSPAGGGLERGEQRVLHV